MKPENNAYNVNQPVESKLAWQRPAIGYIDIKRTMLTLGGSVTDSVFTGTASTTQA